jgi:hypothetical protein
MQKVGGIWSRVIFGRILFEGADAESVQLNDCLLMAYSSLDVCCLLTANSMRTVRRRIVSNCTCLSASAPSKRIQHK